MNRFATDWTNRRISVFRALATGFDRIAAKPILILPSFLLDIFLWFGPHLTIPSIIEMLTTELGAPLNVDPAMAQQASAIQETLALFGDRFNLFSSLSTLPAGMPFNLIFSVFSSLLVGLPSLMATRMPVAHPLGSAVAYSMSAPQDVILIWLGMTILGIGAGILYNRWLIHQVDPGARIGSALLAWGRLLLLACIGYVGGALILLLSGLIASGQGVVYLGMPMLFVAAVYLAFTPHAILRYRMGIWGAVKQSLWFVRWNFLGAFGYLVTGFVIIWLSTVQVWSLPDEGSWFNLLAILGHAFVSATILAGSYAFFQGRRQWLMARFEEAARKQVLTQEPIQDGQDDTNEG